MQRFRAVRERSSHETHQIRRLRRRQPAWRAGVFRPGGAIGAHAGRRERGAVLSAAGASVGRDRAGRNPHGPPDRPHRLSQFHHSLAGPGAGGQRPAGGGVLAALAAAVHRRGRGGRLCHLFFLRRRRRLSVRPLRRGKLPLPLVARGELRHGGLYRQRCQLRRAVSLLRPERAFAGHHPVECGGVRLLLAARGGAAAKPHVRPQRKSRLGAAGQSFQRETRAAVHGAAFAFQRRVAAGSLLLCGKIAGLRASH